MSNTATTWTKKELEIYLLIFCANANYSESKDEKKFIKDRAQSDVYQKMHSEFEKDNDFQSIQKIQSSMEELNFSKAEKDQLFAEVRELILCDGTEDILEENIFRGLKHLL